MARRLLRLASVALAGGAVFGAIVGAEYMLYAIAPRNGPGDLVGLLAAWALVIWGTSGLVAGLAVWTWRAGFRTAVIVNGVAGVVIGYWASLDFGHDGMIFPGAAVVAVAVLVSTASALAVSRRGSSSIQSRDESP